MTGNEPRDDLPTDAVPPTPAPSPDPPPFATGDPDDIPWSDEFLWPQNRQAEIAANEEWVEVDVAAPSPSVFRRSLLLVVLAVLLVLLFRSGGPPASDPVPTDLLGRWTTEAPALAGRGFVISLGEIGFEQGDGRIVRYAIRHVQHDQERGLHRYRLTYGAEGGDATIDLEYNPTSRALRLTSRPGVIWRK